MSYVKEFDKVISLGSNCCCKIYIDYLKIDQETNFFDYIGSSMWAIYNLFKENRFDDVFNDKSSFENMKILNNGDRYIITNKEFYLRFKHDFKHNYYKLTSDMLKTDEMYNKVKEKYTRRITRLREYLDSDNKVLFFRIEENDSDRISYDEYKDKKNISELEYLKKLSSFLKSKYSLNFQILYLSTSEKESRKLEEYNITVLKINNIEWFSCCRDFDRILEKYKDMLYKK